MHSCTAVDVEKSMNFLPKYVEVKIHFNRPEKLFTGLFIHILQVLYSYFGLLNHIHQVFVSLFTKVQLFFVLFYWQKD